MWKKIERSFNEQIGDALEQQHFAAQFIAMAGRHLIPRQPDDSNTNMYFDTGYESLIGNPLSNAMRLALYLPQLRIHILKPNGDKKHEITLEGKSMQQVFAELKQALSSSGIDTTGFINELHYEIPGHKLGEGAAFNTNSEILLRENTEYRHNAEIVLKEIAQGFERAEAVRVWPHHFDTGSLIPVSNNNEGKLIQSIGIGWAIPDNMVKEPYYYLSYWSEKPIDKPLVLDAPGTGNWMMPQWNGAVLKHSEILKAGDANDQYEMVRSFFKTGISILQKRMPSL